MDPRQYIATLTNKGTLEMEFIITRGQNYVVSSKIDSVIPTGFLAVDAVFHACSQKLTFFVETSRNKISSELESLILEIWTNGSMTTSEALSTSAEILENTFGILKITDTSRQHSHRLKFHLSQLQKKLNT